MILILKSNATDEQIDHVLQRVEAMGLQHHLSRGTYRTIVGIIGDEEQLREEPLRAIPGVASVVPVLPPYKLASRDAHPESSVVDVSGVKIGGGHLGMIAGPCSVEDRDRMFRIAEAVSNSGANLYPRRRLQAKNQSLFVPRVWGKQVWSCCGKLATSSRCRSSPK